MVESVGDLLLYAVSAWRDVTLESFSGTFDEVYVRQAPARTEGEPIRFRRSAALRTLDAQAHVDFDSSSENARVRAAPAVLAALPTPGLARAVLCGARSPATVGQVANAARGLGVRLVLRPAATIYGTTVVELEAASRTSHVGLARELNVAYSYPPPAFSILAASGSLDEYLSGLRWTREREVDWPRVDFDTRTFEFRESAGSSPLRLSRYTDPVRQIPRFRLWRGDESADVDPRWARYAAIRSAEGESVSYDYERGIVRVPRSSPLPRLLSRALVLCSGSAPQTVRSESGAIRMFDEYRGVPPDLFAGLGAKLGLVGRALMERQ